MTTFDAFADIVRTGGYKNMYRGSSVAALTILPQTALMIPLFDVMNSYMPNGVTTTIGAGAVAAFVASLILYPLDTIKRCVIVSGHENYHNAYKGPLEAYDRIKENHGFKGLYRGFGFHLVKFLPSAYLQFLLFKYVQDNFTEPK